MDLGLNAIATEPMATSDEDDVTVAVAKQLSTELLKLKTEAISIGNAMDTIAVEKMTDSSSMASSNTNTTRNETSSLSSDNDSSPEVVISCEENLVVAENLVVVPVAAPPHVAAEPISSTTSNGMN